MALDLHHIQDLENSLHEKLTKISSLGGEKKTVNHTNNTSKKAIQDLNQENNSKHEKWLAYHKEVIDSDWKQMRDLIKDLNEENKWQIKISD